MHASFAGPVASSSRSDLTKGLCVRHAPKALGNHDKVRPIACLAFLASTALPPERQRANGAVAVA